MKNAINSTLNSKTSSTINVVEPTLTSEAGHCYSFIAALCRASEASGRLRVWAGRGADLAFPGPNVELKKYFYRPLRRLQSFFLYRKLLEKQGKVFVSTARHADLLLLDWASTGVIPPRKAYLYVHWFKPSERKLASLRRLARRQPNLELYGPTVSVASVFQEAGFGRARVVPYPISPAGALFDAGAPRPFRHLLYAGAARSDKGFSRLVDLVEHLQRSGLRIPVVLQTSSEHGTAEAAIRADLQRLQNVGYPWLRTCPDTLAASEYAQLFEGAICIQLYDALAFRDRISGVTLDAFCAGCPVLSTPGSWIAGMVQRFGAGLLVDDSSPQQVLGAVQRLRAGYADFSRQARAAGAVLQQENDARTLTALLAG